MMYQLLLYFTNNPPEGNALNNIWGVLIPNNTANGAFLFSDMTRSNTVENPLLGSISYSQNLKLNPRPQAGSPALTHVLPGAPQSVRYRGAFAANDQWASGWTGLFQLGVLSGIDDCCCEEEEAVVVVPVPTTLSVVQTGSNLEISFLTQTGLNYQLQSRASLITGTWNDAGSIITGTGGVVTVPAIPIGPDHEYFRVVVSVP